MTLFLISLGKFVFLVTNYFDLLSHFIKAHVGIKINECVIPSDLRVNGPGISYYWDQAHQGIPKGSNLKSVYFNFSTWNIYTNSFFYLLFFGGLDQNIWFWPLLELCSSRGFQPV